MELSHRPCCLHPLLTHRAGKNGIMCFSSAINHIANCVGDPTAVLCRKLLFIFYLTKLKAERVLIVPFCGFSVFSALAQPGLFTMHVLYCKCGTNEAQISN